MTPERKAELRALAKADGCCSGRGPTVCLASCIDELLDALDAAEKERDELRSHQADLDRLIDFIERAKASEAALEVARDALLRIVQHSTPAALVARDALAKLPARKP